MSFKRLLLPALALAVMAPAAVGAQSVGIASWYGARHDGLRTSSGATFDQEGMTAASRSLPLGSRVRVTMHETGRSVVVLVNDRMGGRSAIIDLAKGAAREIGLLGRGRGMVSIAAADDEPVEIAEASQDDARRAGGASAPPPRMAPDGGQIGVLLPFGRIGPLAGPGPPAWADARGSSPGLTWLPSNRLCLQPFNQHSIFLAQAEISACAHPPWVLFAHPTQQRTCLWPSGYATTSSVLAIDFLPLVRSTVSSTPAPPP